MGGNDGILYTLKEFEGVRFDDNLFIMFDIFEETSATPA